MKILQISSAQAFGGGERHLADLSNELVRRGHDVYAVLRPRSSLSARLSELEPKRISTLPLRNALDVTSANKLARFVKQHQVEIIHAHMARDYSLAAYAARRNPSTKLILTRHVLFRLNRWHRRLLARAARVIAVSDAVASQLRSQNLFPASRITVVRNGVDIEALAAHCGAADRAERRRNLDLPEDSFLIGAVGQLNPLKGHEVFLRAAALVVESFPQARFVIAGADVSAAGETIASLKRLISELGLKSHVRLLGEVENVTSVLAALDLFVSASRAESFGLAIVEAMACSLPVVATDTQGAHELIEENQTGLIVPIDASEHLAASIITLLADAHLRMQMGHHGYVRAREQFGLKRMVDNIEMIYQESLAD